MTPGVGDDSGAAVGAGVGDGVASGAGAGARPAAPRMRGSAAAAPSAGRASPLEAGRSPLSRSIATTPRERVPESSRSGPAAQPTAAAIAISATTPARASVVGAPSGLVSLCASVRRSDT